LSVPTADRKAKRVQKRVKTENLGKSQGDRLGKSSTYKSSIFLVY